MPSRILRRTRRTFWNGLRLRCPRCGRGDLFRGFFAMHDACGVCGLRYEREPGYFVGAIYVNYAFTAVLGLGGYFALDAVYDLSLTAEIALWGCFSTIFPLWFFRYSRSLWLALDHVFSPEPPTLRPVRPRSKPSPS